MFSDLTPGVEGLRFLCTFSLFACVPFHPSPSKGPGTFGLNFTLILMLCLSYHCLFLSFQNVVDMCSLMSPLLFRFILFILGG